LILISHEVEDRALLAEALTTKSGHKVEVIVPQRGERKDLVAHALANAREALGRKLAETSSQQRLLRQLTETFGLPRVPRRIEVYDNSHIQGSNAVGAMIVAGPEGFRKSDYRKFNIRSANLTPGDDFAMMREVLTRRFKRLLAEAPRVEGISSETNGRESSVDLTASADDSVDDFPVSAAGDNAAALPPEETDILRAQSEEPDDSPWPDLVLIDGGQGQLTAAREVFAEFGIDVPLVAVAKGPDRDAGRETFFIPGRDSFKLPPRDPVLYFVERLRDEAHRFAVGSHRIRRQRQMREAGLQEIAGIGPTRKRALLHHFGTLKAIERASVNDLLQVDGISAETARRIYEFFHEGAA
jgi:excinuclease ABC subunit C